MVDHIVHVYGFNLMNAETLVKDISTEQMVEQPNGVVNHPAWSLGHLVVVANALGKALGLTSNLPDGWDKTFATGGEPSDQVSDFPSKEEILGALREHHERNTDAIKNIDPAALAAPHPNENMRSVFPTVGDMVVFLMTGHEMTHLGQIAAWRRVMGLGPASGS